MGTFSASLKTPGDRTGLAATLRVEQGRLRIDAGDTPIGEWSREEIDLEPVAGGFRLSVEGEQILVETDQAEALQAELTPKKEKKKPARRAEKSRRRKEPKPPKARATRDKPDRKDAPKPKERSNPVATVLDAMIVFGEKKLGAVLPSWVFTRVVALALLIAVALTVVLPGIMSVVILVAGILAVLLGAMAYADTVVASKWLPGRTRPDHMLIAGVVVLLVGILIRFLAR